MAGQRTAYNDTVGQRVACNNTARRGAGEDTARWAPRRVQWYGRARRQYTVRRGACDDTVGRSAATQC